jgi:protein gp37
MSDLFHESLSNEQIVAVFGVMAATPQHQYVILTKRLQRAVEWFGWIWQQGALVPSLIGVEVPPGASGEAAACTMIASMESEPIPPAQHVIGTHREWPLNNLIVCASVENQPTVDERVPLLLQIPAAYHGVSVEPMLEGIDFYSSRGGTRWMGGQRGCDGKHMGVHYHDDRCNKGLDLVICGAETGPGKRPFRDEWALDLRDQCRDASTPFFFKKDGQGNPTLCGVEYREWIGG